MFELLISQVNAHSQVKGILNLILTVFLSSNIGVIVVDVNFIISSLLLLFSCHAAEYGYHYYLYDYNYYHNHFFFVTIIVINIVTNTNTNTTNITTTVIIITTIIYLSFLLFLLLMLLLSLLQLFLTLSILPLYVVVSSITYSSTRRNYRSTSCKHKLQKTICHNFCLNVTASSVERERPWGECWSC